MRAPVSSQGVQGEAEHRGQLVYKLLGVFRDVLPYSRGGEGELAQELVW